MKYEEMLREQYRGEDKAEWVVKPIDPSLPHRFVETDIGRKNTCVICGCKKVCRHDIHSDTAKQHTVTFRDREEDAKLRGPANG